MNLFLVLPLPLRLYGWSFETLGTENLKALLVNIGLCIKTSKREDDSRG
ncbi:hypothetical protein SLEP1_g40566 [Rubroshorea leprosula]|uniref:Uncharacterized protein n=1 Tax=Rubroshorea leprosula TaxID=152421 RepID=A0AAV5L494_9ROSI|nr:hypothetical protein SLEP1_g40566 [Rubroshorea leprosula]